MILANLLPAPINRFLMIDVYNEASAEDKEFLDILLFVAKMINALKSPISFLRFIGLNIRKWI